MTNCPQCEGPGSKIDGTTLQLLEPASLERVRHDGRYRVCKNETCDVVYFDDSGAEPFRTADVSVPVFQKETDPDRLVCYCFEHTVRQVQDDVTLHGESTIAESIREKCQQGLDRCEELNPQGRCCLGNVRQLAREVHSGNEGLAPGPVADCCAPAALSQPMASGDAAGAQDCCATDVATTVELAVAREFAMAPARDRNLGLFSVGGALTAAVLSSACCWLPLALIGFGASAAGVGGFFEAYRLWFLGGAALLLGGGFYYVYFRKPQCAPGEACEVPNPRLERFNRVTLWVATLLIVGFAAFPEYVSLLFPGSSQPPAVVNASALTTRTYAITGMTCEGCEAHVQQTLAELPEVAAAQASYADELATVQTSADVETTDLRVVEAIRGIGYEAHPRETVARTD